MTARRPLLTAAAAGSVLLALWFVPSANATVEHGERTTHAPRSAQQDPATQPQSAGQTPQSAQREPDALLADTGAFDTTPYVIGGAAFLGIGAGLVGFSVRRTRGSGI
ncbi:hypothetical protein [Streptomyces albofaciens]|uniref:hypothetical protein n=1 Tax=Streptomyces albofaciens TaxID=66866 RepID=UPI00142EA5DB|nr:hypothetical protein [Streptomyces albofaciens]